ncbi:hypothetical protein JOC75_004731 [Metabacillus crassostreae]|uniref:DUF4275 family protein n=1 Tax=Metabacillus crassostreae TaxID=929098 RepID=UPI0019595F77|nr:DUF4275 family protein [Metabacillus crassostreae]MBM7606677.1 hypothetical protein [Metabacillus crassostreae]
MIRTKINQLLDKLPEEELENVYWSIKSIEEEYLYNKNLQDKGVVISDIEDSEELIKRWDRTFAKNISDHVKRDIYYDQFRWHIFSYEKQECLEEEAARNAFNAVEKQDLYIMYQGVTSVLLYLNASELVAENFDSQQDIYIFDKNFSWTYVNTHESMCGPYFYKVENR